MSKEANCKIIGYGALRDAHMCVTHDGRLMAVTHETFPPATLKCLFDCDENGAYKGSEFVLVSKESLISLLTALDGLIKTQEKEIHSQDEDSEAILYESYLNLLRDKLRYYKKITEGYCDVFADKN